MKIALEQLRRRLYDMLKEKEKTLSLAICSRNWKEVIQKVQVEEARQDKQTLSSSTQSETKQTELISKLDENQIQTELFASDLSCHNRSPLQLALMSGAPFNALQCLINIGSTKAAAIDWKSGRGYFTPLMIAHRHGNLTTITKSKNKSSTRSTSSTNATLTYRVWEFETTIQIKQQIWKKLDPAVHHTLSTACLCWMWKEASKLYTPEAARQSDASGK